jgi:hypothetical protein
MKPFTNADIGKPVRILARGWNGEIGRVATLGHPAGYVWVMTEACYVSFPPEELERGELVTQWVPES